LRLLSNQTKLNKGDDYVVSPQQSNRKQSCAWILEKLARPAGEVYINK
jgi:hypothetical protein